MNYTLHQLQIFLEVVKMLSITKAAREMHMTQPALSIQLRNFQNQFEIPLYEVIGKQIHITEFGMSIAGVIENILKEADAIKYKTKEYNGLFTGKLSISSASTGKYIIPYFLAGFLKEHSGIDLVLDVSNKAEVIKSLKKNEVDFALVSTLPQNLAVEEEILVENKLYKVSQTEKIDKTKPLIFREDGSATRTAMSEYFKKYDSRKSIQLMSNEAIKQAVVAGLGNSIIPLIGIKNELINKELYIIKAKGLPITTNWRLIWLKNKKLSPVAQEYLNFIRQHKEEIINENFKWYLNFDKK